MFSLRHVGLNSGFVVMTTDEVILDRPEVSVLSGGLSSVLQSDY